MMKRIVGLALLTVALSGCGFEGIQSMPLPGTVGTGEGIYQLTVELPDVGTLVENADVKVDDVVVGTVTDLAVDQWHAKATISLREETALPTDSTARVGYNSLLGAAFLELTPGEGRSSAQARQLQGGDTIPLVQSGTYPSTEQVLTSASVVLNGSGLQQLRTVTVELKRALASQDGSGVGALLPRLNSFVGAVDAQRSDITTAIDRLGRLSSSFAEDMPVVDRALDELEPALAVLNRERPRLVKALKELDRLADVSTRAVRLAKADLRGVLEELAPALAALNASGDSLVGGLRYLLTPPFAPESVPNACRGDYCNLFLTLDLSTGTLLQNLTPSSPTGGQPTPSGIPTIPGLPGLPVLPNLSGTLQGLTGAGSTTAPSALGPVLGLLGGRSTP